MGVGHGHGHAAGRAVDRSRLKVVLAVTLAIGVGVALSASYVATLPASSKRTFGLHRAEILAALANAVVLLGVCGYLAVEGVRRLVDPTPVETGPMLVFAVVGLVATGI